MTYQDSMAHVFHNHPWRGHDWKYWEDFFVKRKSAAIRQSMEEYAQSALPKIQNPSRNTDIELLIETLDNYKPALDEKQVIDAINGLPPPASVVIPSDIQSAIFHPSYPLAGGDGLRNPPDAGPSSAFTPPLSRSSYNVSSNKRPDQRNPGAARRTRLDLDEPGAASKPSLSRLPGIVDVEREARELLHRRHFQGLLLERGRPELIRNRAWPEAEVINSQEHYEGLHTGACDPRISEVQIVKNKPAVGGENPHFYKFSNRGFRYPYYGRGPVWNANSCALDSCIVAARLLNVGSLSADKGDASVYEWIDSLPKLALDFLQLLARPWETYPSVHNTFCKDQFRTKLGPVYQNGSTMSVVNLWKRCTEGVNQFTYSEYWYSRCSRCGRETSNQSNPTVMQDLALDGVSQAAKRASGGSPDMAQRLNRHFEAQTRQCRKKAGGCGIEEAVMRRRMISGTLPPRLVVLAPLDDADKDIPGVTSNHIPIDYGNTEGPQTANYRWIGGLYRSRLGNIDHYRVYWADWEQGEYDGGLKIYDGTRLGGAIVGGIPPYSDDDWVPPYWSRRPDVIFYEHVEEIDIELVADTIRSTVDNQLDELVPIPAVPALRCNPKGKYREVETEDLQAPPVLPTPKPSPKGKDRKIEKIAALMPNCPRQQTPMPPPATKPSQKRKNREDEPAAGPSEQRSPRRIKQPAPPSDLRDGHISVSD